MPKRHHHSKMQKQVESASADDFAVGNYSSVFIDTNLDTHLATVVSHSDTVSDLKAKILLEHLQCFPKIGEIEIHGLKVKRRGNLYHLSESMRVSSAFETNKKDLFISVDASCVAKPLALVHFQPNHSDESLCKKIGCTHCASPKPIGSHVSAPKECQDVNDEVKDRATDQRDETSQSLDRTHAIKKSRKSNKQDDLAALDHVLKHQAASTNSAVAAAREACNNTETEADVVNDQIMDSVPAEQKKKRKLDVHEISEIPLHYKRRKYGDEDRLSKEYVEPEDSSNEKTVQEIAEMSKVTPPLVDADIDVPAGESQFDVDDRFVADGKSKLVSEQEAAADGSSSGAVIDDTIIEHLPEAEQVPFESVKVGETKKRKAKRVCESSARMSQSAINDDSIQKDESFLSRIEHVAEASLQQNPVDTSNKELSNMNGHPEMNSLTLSQPNSKNNVDIGEKMAEQVPLESVEVGETKKRKDKKRVRQSGARISQSATNSVIHDDSIQKDESFLSRIEYVAEASLLQNPVDTSNKELSNMNGHPALPVTQPSSKNDAVIGEKLGTAAVIPEGNFDVATAVSSKKSKSKKVKKVLVSNQDLLKSDSAGGIVLPVDDHLNVEPKSKQVSEQKQVDGSSFDAVKENEDLPQGNHDKNIENKESLLVLAEPAELLSSKVGEPKKKKKKKATKLADGISKTANDRKLADGISKTANDPVVDRDSVDVMKINENFLSPTDVDPQQNPVDTSRMASDKELSIVNESNSKTNVAVDEKSRKKLNEDEKVEDAVDIVSKPKRKPVKKQKLQTKSRLNLPTNDGPLHQSIVSDEKTKQLKTDKNEAKSEIDFKNYFVSEQKVKKVISEGKNNRLKPEKSLLLTPPTIFGEDSSSDSSDNEKKTANARRNIPTPSSSSGSSMDSVKNARKVSGKKNKISPKPAAPTGLSLDMIMRNSSTFKAKLTQLQDSESQPIEFVPDSQPDS